MMTAVPGLRPRARPALKSVEMDATLGSDENQSDSSVTSTRNSPTRMAIAVNCRMDWIYPLQLSHDSTRAIDDVVGVRQGAP